MIEYDFYLKSRDVGDGNWIGFPLAWKGLGQVPGLPARPQQSGPVWVPDPSAPEDPSLGHWAPWRWRYTVAALDGLIGLDGTPLDGRDSAGIRDELMAFVSLSDAELQDLDGATYTIRMTAYLEQAIEAYDNTHVHGGWLISVELTQLA